MYLCCDRIIVLVQLYCYSKTLKSRAADGAPLTTTPIVYTVDLTGGVVSVLHHTTVTTLRGVVLAFTPHR